MQRTSPTAFWAVVLIGLGVLLLIANLTNAWNLVCPLFLIGVGVLFLLGGLPRVFFSAPDVKTERFSAPIDGATSARVDLGLSVGEARITALADAETLIDANLTYVGNIDFAASGDAEKTVRLRQTWDHFLGWLNPANWFHAPMELKWDIGLSPHVPMTLEVAGGVGKSWLDLYSLQVSDLRVSGGTGRLEMVLPAVSAGYTATVTGGTGSVDVKVPDGASVGMSLSGGTGAIRLSVGEGAAVNARITGGTGRVTVEVPRDAAVHLKAQTGVGSIAVPPHFARLAGGEQFVGQSGVWETPNFSQAERQITIEFSGGVGGLTVQ